MRGSVSALLILVLVIALAVPVVIGVSNGIAEAQKQNEIDSASSSEPVDINLSLSETSVIINEGKSKTVTVVTEEETESFIFQWKSNDSDIVTAARSAESDTAGTITAVGTGETTVTLNIIDKSKFKIVKSFTVEVKALPAVDDINIYLDDGNTADLPSAIIPGDNVEIIWSSEDESVATVENGVIVAHKAGQVYLWAKSGDIENRVLVNVYDTEFCFNDEITYMTVGSAESISVQGNIGEGAKWTSSDDKVITVDENGNVNALKVGMANLKVVSAYDGQVAECTVVVKSGSEEAVKFIKNNKATASSDPGNWYYYPDNVDTTKIPYMDNGVVEFKFKLKENQTGVQNFYIRYQPDEYGDVFYNITLYIYAYQEANAEVAGYNTGKEITLSQGVNVLDIENYKSAVPGTSGAYQIKFKTPGKYIVIPIFEETRMTEKIVLSDDYVTINTADNKQATLSASVIGRDATTIEWISSNPAVATVNGEGVITAVSEGYTMITAKDGDLKALCLVRVDGESALSGTKLSSGNKSVALSKAGEWVYYADTNCSVHTTPIMTDDGSIHLPIQAVNTSGKKWVYLRYQPTEEGVTYKATITIDYTGEDGAVIEVSGGMTTVLTKEINNGVQTIEFTFTSNANTPLSIKFKAVGCFVVNVELNES